MASLVLFDHANTSFKPFVLHRPHLQEGLGPGGAGLEHDGEDGEDDDLDGGATRVPVGSADSVLEEGIQFHGIMLSSKLYYDIIQKRKTTLVSWH